MKKQINQVIYAGDGASDMPVFRWLSKSGGKAIGVYRPGHPVVNWGGYQSMRKGGRVETRRRLFTEKTEG